MDAIKLLKKKKHLLKLRQVENDIGMPKTSLSVYLTKGYLPGKWEKPLIDWIAKNLK
jgi:hypothetical protein